MREKLVSGTKAADLLWSEVEAGRIALEEAKEAVTKAELLLHTGAKLKRCATGLFVVMSSTADGSDLVALKL